MTILKPFCAALLAVVALSSAPAVAGTLVYVEDFEVRKPVKPQGGSLAGILCNQMSKNKNLEIMCAPDVQQMLQFAALSGSVGNQSNPQLAIEDRMGKVEVVVKGSIRKGKYGLILLVEVFERDKKFAGTVVTPGRKLGAIERKGIKGGTQAVMDKLPALAPRIAAMARGEATGSKKSAPPPPLKKGG